MLGRFPTKPSEFFLCRYIVFDVGLFCLMSVYFVDCESRSEYQCYRAVNQWNVFQFVQLYTECQVNLKHICPWRIHPDTYGTELRPPGRINHWQVWLECY